MCEGESDILQKVLVSAGLRRVEGGHSTGSGRRASAFVAMPGGAAGVLSLWP